MKLLSPFIISGRLLPALSLPEGVILSRETDRPIFYLDFPNQNRKQGEGSYKTHVIDMRKQKNINPNIQDQFCSVLIWLMDIVESLPEWTHDWINRHGNICYILGIEILGTKELIIS